VATYDFPDVRIQQVDSFPFKRKGNVVHPHKWFDVTDLCGDGLRLLEFWVYSVSPRYGQCKFACEICGDFHSFHIENAVIRTYDVLGSRRINAVDIVAFPFIDWYMANMKYSLGKFLHRSGDVLDTPKPLYMINAMFWFRRFLQTPGPRPSSCRIELLRQFNEYLNYNNELSVNWATLDSLVLFLFKDYPSITPLHRFKFLDRLS